MLIAVTILVVLLLRRWLSRPLGQLSRAIANVADGNLKVNLDELNDNRGGDEVRAMTASVKLMCERLSRCLSAGLCRRQLTFAAQCRY